MKLRKIVCVLLFLSSYFVVSGQKTEKGIEKSREINYYLIEAKEALTHGNVQKAISLYNQCLVIKKDCAVAHYEMANIAIAVNDLTMALQHSRSAVAISPKNVWYKLQLAEIMEARGMLEKAAETYLDLAKLEMQNPFYLQKSEMLFETVENWDKALEICELMEEEYGKDFNLLARKQGLYSKANRRKDGYAELKKLIKENPNNSEYYSLLAMRYQEDGEDKKAKKIYEKITGLDSISGVAEMLLYRHYVRNKDFSKACEALKKSIKSGEVDENENIKAVIVLLSSDTTKQVDVYRNTLSGLLIEKYPNNVYGYLFKAQEYGEAKEYEKAKKVLEKALEIDPENYNGLAQLSLLQNIEKDWDTLYKTAEKGISYYPQEHLFYLFKGLASSQNKKYQIAESSLRTAYLYAKQEKDKADIQELLADVYYKGGKKQEAFELFEQVLSENPDKQTVMNNYAYFLSLEKTDLEKAEKMSKKTIDKEPENPTYLDTYAWILYQQNKYDEAFEYMKKAIANLDDEGASSEMWEHYGDILFKMGQKEQAVKEWEKALTLPEPETDRLEKKIIENR